MTRTRAQSPTSEPKEAAAPARAEQARPAQITVLDGTDTGTGTGTNTNQAEAASAAMSSTSGPEPSRPTKAGLLQQRLAGPGGATLADLMHATGWQAHTVRAALTHLRQAGHAVERSRSDEGGTVYRIRQPSAASEVASAARATAPGEAPTS